MKIEEIYRKFKKFSHPIKGNGGHINISGTYLMINDLFKHGYVVSGYEFLRITDKFTQPFMEYSVWKEGGYTKDEMYRELDILKKSF